MRSAECAALREHHSCQLGARPGPHGLVFLRPLSGGDSTADKNSVRIGVGTREDMGPSSGTDGAASSAEELLLAQRLW